MSTYFSSPNTSQQSPHPPTTCRVSTRSCLGLNCEREIDECVEIKPCQHDSTCKNRPGSYECDCGEGYRGRHCEIADCDLVNCTGAPCLITNATDEDGAVTGSSWTCNCTQLGPFIGGKSIILRIPLFSPHFSCFSVFATDRCQDGFRHITNEEQENRITI